jgi:hypothetical protein
MAHRKRVSAYRRQGVSAFAYLLKLTSANRSRFTFCFQQNAKSRNFMAVGGGVSAWGEGERVGVSAGGVSALGRRGNVSAYRRGGGGGSSIHLRFRVRMNDLSKRVNLRRPKRFGFLNMLALPEKRIRTLSLRRHAHTPTRRPVPPTPTRPHADTPTRSLPLPRRHAHTPTRRHADPFPHVDPFPHADPFPPRRYADTFPFPLTPIRFP